MVLNSYYTEYDSWAWLYNQTMGPEYSVNQIRPLENLLLPLIPNDAHLLDLCCGTGQLAHQLTERGYRVVGLDGSSAMLDYARQNAPQAEFVWADARKFNLPDQVDAAFSTSASLNHMISLADLKAALQSVYVALREDGLFLFDLNHPAQMSKWWSGKIVEGEITISYAWSLVPVYDPSQDLGYFKVSLFQSQGMRLNPFKNLLYRLLSLRWLTRLRLRLLAQFQEWEPTWQRSSMTYRVTGYSEQVIRRLLEEVGFTEIQVQTIDETPVDANHSAYFRCRKPVNRRE